MPEPSPRRLALVAGTDPAAVDTVTAALAALGLGSPDPAWVAELHADLLRRGHLEVDDARPAAWFEAGKACANGITRARLTEWLGERYDDRLAASAAGGPEAKPELVVGDPGLAWFLGLWRAAALRCDAEAVHVVVVRPAPEVATDAPAVAAWLNRVLHVERATRETPRVVVSHQDVVEDWTVPFVGLGARLGLRAVQEATANQIRQGHTAVADAVEAAGPTAARTWADLEVPAPLRELAEETWEVMAPLADPTGSDGPAPEVTARLDGLRAAYQRLYDDAEALVSSSLRAARVQARAEATAITAAASGSPAGSAHAATGSAARLRRVLGRGR